MSPPPLGIQSSNSDENATSTAPPHYAVTPLLLSSFRPETEPVQRGTDVSAHSALNLRTPPALSLAAYRGMSGPAAHREDSTRPSSYSIPLPEGIHRGTVHRSSADSLLHELRAPTGSPTRGEGALLGGGSSNTRVGPPAAMGGRESTVSAGSAPNEYGLYWRIPASPRPAPQPAFSHFLAGAGSSRLGREVHYGHQDHPVHNEPRPASSWLLQRPLEPTLSITTTPPAHFNGSEITASQSPEGGHVRSTAPGSDSSGTPSARPLPTPANANPPRNWEDGYGLQQVVERDESVANEDRFGGVVTLPEQSAGFTHPQAAFQCNPALPFLANSFAASSSWNTMQTAERVQIGRQISVVETTAQHPSLADISTGGGFGALGTAENIRHPTRQFHPSPPFINRLTLPTPIPFIQNPSSKPLPKRPYSSGESSAGYLSGPSSTPPALPQLNPTIASSSGSATGPSVLALGTRAPVSSPAQPPLKTSGVVRAPRKKTHGCWMCHKSFDRPSTLKKHLLVHTGEKAHVCVFCSRRFGVASNLNRHTKRCPQRPKDASALVGPSPSSNFPSLTQPASTTCTLNLNIRKQVPFSESSPFGSNSSSKVTVSTLDLHEGPRPSSSASTSFYVYPTLPSGSMARSSHNPSSTGSGNAPGRDARNAGARRQRSPFRRPSASGVELSTLPGEGGPASRRPRTRSRSREYDARESPERTSMPSNAETVALSQQTQPRKRPRRPPSPSTWVPASLAGFRFYDVPAHTRASPCPLPPVKPVYDHSGVAIEERDSFASTQAAIMPLGTSDDEESSSSSDDGEVFANTGKDENSPPSSGAFDASSRARERAQSRENRAMAKAARARARLALYAPYHPVGWSGTLPGPAVVLGTGPEGDAVMERAPGGSGAGAGGDMVGADMTNLRFEVLTGKPSEGNGSSSRSATT